MASDGEPGDSDDDPGMDVDKVTEELDEGGYEPPPPYPEYERERQPVAAIVRRRERELLLTLRTRQDDQRHLTKAHWMIQWVMRSR